MTWRDRLLVCAALLLGVAVFSTQIKSDTIKISLPSVGDDSCWSYQEGGDGFLEETAFFAKEHTSEWEFKAASAGEVVLHFVDNSDESRYITYYYEIDNQNHVTGTRVVGTVQLGDI